MALATTPETVTSSAGDSATTGSLLNVLSGVSGSVDAVFDSSINNATIALTGPLSVTSGSTLMLDTSLLGSAGQISINLGSNTVTPSSSLLINGPGVVALSGNGSNYSGSVTIAGGGEFIVSSAIAAVGALTLDFTGSPNGTVKGSAASIGSDTLKGFNLSDQLIISGTVKKNTTATLSADKQTLTVTDSTEGVSATFTLSGSLADNGATGDETVGLLTQSSSGNAVVTPAMSVQDSIGDDTGAFSLRHALSVITTSFGSGGTNEMVLFDSSVSGKIISVGGATALTLPGTAVRFAVEGSDKVTILGTDSGGVGGFHGSNFHKVGGGTLTLAGDQSALTGIVSVSGGTLDIETTNLTGNLGFKTNNNSTIAGTHLTLNGKTFNSFQPGESIKVSDITFAGSTSLSSAVTSGTGTLTLTQNLPEGTSTSVQLSLAGASVSGATETFVLLRDSTDGSALIRPALSVNSEATLITAVTTLTGSSFSNTSFDVINLASGGEFGVSNSTVNIALGANPILFNVASGVSNTLFENLSGASDFGKTGTGTLTLSGTETLTGTASIGGGTLILANSSFASGAVTLDMGSGKSTVQGTIASLAGLHVTNFHLGDAIELVKVVSGNGGLSVGNPSGSSTIFLSDSSTGTGVNATVNAGYSGGISGVASVFDGSFDQQTIVPLIMSGQTITGDAADLGKYTEIASGGTVQITVHGSTATQLVGAGTLDLNLANSSQKLVLTDATSGIGMTSNGLNSGFTGSLKIDSGILDISANSPSSNLTTINAALTASSAQLNVSTSASGHLTLSSIAGGSAIDVTNVSFATLDTSKSGIAAAGSNAVLTLIDSSSNTVFTATLPGSALAFAGTGGLQFISDGSSGTLVAFGNSVVTAPASLFTANASLGISGGARPTTLSITGSAATIDLSNVTLGGTISSLDVSGTGTSTVKLNNFEAGQFTSIKGSSTTTLQLVTDGVTISTQNLDLTGVSTIDLAGHNDVILINASSPPTALKVFHANVDGTDTIKGTGTTMDLRGVLFTGNGHVTGSAVDGNNLALPTTYIISDGNLLTHIDTYSGNDTINLVDTTQLSATYTPDEIAYALGHNFHLQLNGATFPLPFTPPGGEPVSILATNAVDANNNPIFSGGGGTFTLSGSLAVSGGVTHFALPSGTTFDLSNLTVTGGSAADPIVFFGAPGSTVHLPNAVPGGGQSAVEYEINGGNNVITGGSAPTEIWGGPGNDSVTLTNGAGTVTGGTGTAALNGGNSSAATYGGTGAVLLFGASGGGTLSNGGDHSELISGGGITTLSANPTGVLHQAFFGSQDTSPGASDTFNLIGAAGSSEIVTAGVANATVTGGLSNDTVVAGSGTMNIQPGTTSENLTFVAKQSSGGTERATVGGGAEGTLAAYGGDGADSIAASVGGNSTIVGGVGKDTFFGTAGNGYMLSQGSKDTFQFSGASPGGATVGTFYVEGFTAGTDVLQITTNTSQSGSAFLAGGTLVTIAAGGIVSTTDSLTAHLIGLSALQFTLGNGQKIDIVGVTTINAADAILATGLL